MSPLCSSISNLDSSLAATDSGYHKLISQMLFFIYKNNEEKKRKDSKKKKEEEIPK